MSIQITGKNIDIGDALRSFIDERMDLIIDKFIGRDVAGHVRVQKEHNTFRTSCSIRLNSGLTLESNADSDDAYSSATQSFEKLEKRLRRYKRRLKNHHHDNNHADKFSIGHPAVDSHVESRDDDETANGDESPVIVAETKMVVPDLSVSDAVMQMDLAEQPVLVFRNASHGNVNVVYRRADGNIGWIDPSSGNA